MAEHPAGGDPAGGDAAGGGVAGRDAAGVVAGGDRSGAGGALTVTRAGGGRFSVDSDSIASSAAALTRAESALGAAIARMDSSAAADAVAPARDAPPGVHALAAHADALTQRGTVATRRVIDRLREVATALRVGAAAYGWLDAALTRSAQALAADAAMTLGYVASLFRWAVPPALAAFVVVQAAAELAARDDAARDDAAAAGDGSGDGRRNGRSAGAAGGGGQDRLREALADPKVVMAIRMGVMSADDLIAGLAGLPPAVIRMLGDEGLGVFGLDAAAATVIGAAALGGALRETPVRVRAVGSATGSAAVGFAGRAARVPTGDHLQRHPPDGPPVRPRQPPPQIRIDRHLRAGLPDRFELFIGGTADFSPRATDEPFDLTGNLHGIAGSEGGSLRAVEQALAQAGAGPSSEIVVTGYSQGGLVAANLAASGDHTVTGLLTFGAPAAQIAVPAHVPWVAMEHRDDLVPALGGMWTSDDAVVVTRTALDAEGPTSVGGQPDAPVPAHRFSLYERTAGLADASTDARLAAAARAFDAGPPATRVQTTWFRASRGG